jgi:hypothetical protein
MFRETILAVHSQEWSENAYLEVYTKNFGNVVRKK